MKTVAKVTEVAGYEDKKLKLLKLLFWSWNEDCSKTFIEAVAIWAFLSVVEC